MLLRYLFLFILFVSELVVGIMLIKRKSQKKNVFVWCIGVFAVGYIMSSIIQFSTFFTEQYKLSTYEDTNPRASDNQVYLHEIKVGTRPVKDKNIAAGWWWKKGGHLVYDSAIEGMTDEIVIDVPVGTKRELVFTTAEICGIVRIDSMNQSFYTIVDTYSENGSDIFISIPSSSRKMLLLNIIFKTVLFCISLGVLELLLYYVIKKATDRGKLKNQTKYWLILGLGFVLLFLRYVGPPSGESEAWYQNIFYFENYELGFMSRGLIGQLVCEISPYWTQLQLYLLKTFLAIVFTCIVCSSVSKTLNKYFEQKAAVFIIFFLVFQPLTSILFRDRLRLDVCYLILFLIAVLCIVGKTYFLVYLPLVCMLIIFVNETTCLTIIPSILALAIYKYVSTEDSRYKWTTVSATIASLASVFVTVKYGKGGRYSMEDTFRIISSHYAEELNSEALFAEYYTLEEHFRYAYNEYASYWQEHIVFWLLLIPVFYLVGCLYKAIYVKSIIHRSRKVKISFACLILASFSSISAMMIAIDYGRYMLLVFVILMANFFALVEQEKVSLELKDLYLFSKPQGENILPFVVLVILSWICPFYDTILSSMLEVYPWVNYFNQFL